MVGWVVDVTEMFVLSTMMLTAKAEPEIFWQLRQWQQFVKMGWALSVNWMVSQTQEPFIGRVRGAMVACESVCLDGITTCSRHLDIGLTVTALALRMGVDRHRLFSTRQQGGAGPRVTDATKRSPHRVPNRGARRKDQIARERA